MGDFEIKDGRLTFTLPEAIGSRGFGENRTRAEVSIGLTSVRLQAVSLQQTGSALESSRSFGSALTQNIDLAARLNLLGAISIPLKVLQILF